MTKREYVKLLLRQKQIFERKIEREQKELDGINNTLERFSPELVEKVKKEIEKEDSQCN